MSAPDVLRILGEVWPAQRRGMFRSLPPTAATPDLASAVRRAAASGEQWIFALLYLAWESDGALRQLVLDQICATLSAMPARRWYRLDSLARPGWGCYLRTKHPGDDAASEAAILETIRAGLRRWSDCTSLASVRRVLGSHSAPLLLATMHRSGHVREAAVVALGGDVLGIPALLVRANDWVPPIRESALRSLHRLVDPTHLPAWLHALPLLVRLESCGRASHAPLIDRVGALFRTGEARQHLLDAVRVPDAATARASAAMVVRTCGMSDREAVAALLECPDTLVRLRAIDAHSIAMDETLLEVALNDPVAMIRRHALDALRERDADRFSRRIRTACFDRSASVREFAIFHLRKAGAFDVPSLAAEAVDRLSARRGGVIGPLAFLCDLEGDAHAATIGSFVDHPSGRVRLSAKRWSIRTHRPGRPLDPRLLDDPSPKIARHLVALLRTHGEAPDWPRIVQRFQASSNQVEASAWLDTLAKNRIWEALPHLVRALHDDRDDVAARARQLIDATTGRTFRRYVHPDEAVLGELASALRACRDPRAGRLTIWVRAVTGRGEWP